MTLCSASLELASKGLELQPIHSLIGGRAPRSRLFVPSATRPKPHSVTVNQPAFSLRFRLCKLTLEPMSYVCRPVPKGASRRLAHSCSCALCVKILGATASTEIKQRTPPRGFHKEPADKAFVTTSQKLQLLKTQASLKKSPARAMRRRICPGNITHYLSL